MKIIIKPSKYILTTSSGSRLSPKLNLEIVDSNGAITSITLGEYYEATHYLHGNYDVRLKHTLIPFRKKKVYLDKDKDYEVILTIRVRYFFKVLLFLVIISLLLIVLAFLFYNVPLHAITILSILGFIFYLAHTGGKLTDYEFVEYSDDLYVGNKVPIEFDSYFYLYRGSANSIISNQMHLYINDIHVCKVGKRKIYHEMVKPLSNVEIKIGARKYYVMEYKFEPGKRYRIDSSLTNKNNKQTLVILFISILISTIIMMYIGEYGQISLGLGLLIGMFIGIILSYFLGKKYRKFSIIQVTDSSEPPNYYEKVIYLNLNINDEYSLRSNNEYLCYGSDKYQKVYIKDVDNLVLEYKNKIIKLPITNYIDNEFYKLNYSYPKYLRTVLLIFSGLFIICGLVLILLIQDVILILFALILLGTLVSSVYKYIKHKVLKITITLEPKDKALNELVNSLQNIVY